MASLIPLRLTRTAQPRLGLKAHSSGLKSHTMKIVTPSRKNHGFEPKTFLATIGSGRKTIEVPRKHAIFAQGDVADAVFYIQLGKVKLTVVSQAGKEATIGILSDGDFFGEGALAGQPLRMGSAAAMTECKLMRIEKKAMMEALHREHAFSDMFVAYLLARNIRYEEDLVDQLFNSSEKRLARVLLLMAQFGKEGVSEMSVPRLSQETLAEMVGTTRSRVSFFMNRFRKLGFINYDVGDNLRVHSSLLNVVLRDDEGITLTPGARNPAAGASKTLEPPPERGGPPDKERAKRPRLPGVAQG
jgi:CRP/FNR family transcriptional regulator, cyclic AMP receptor protein